jgi:hypothetical protein
MSAVFCYWTILKFKPLIKIINITHCKFDMKKYFLLVLIFIANLGMSQDTINCKLKNGNFTKVVILKDDPEAIRKAFFSLGILAPELGNALGINYLNNHFYSGLQVGWKSIFFEANYFPVTYFSKGEINRTVYYGDITREFTMDTKTNDGSHYKYKQTKLNASLPIKYKYSIGPHFGASHIDQTFLDDKFSTNSIFAGITVQRTKNLTAYLVVNEAELNTSYITRFHADFVHYFSRKLSTEYANQNIDDLARKYGARVYLDVRRIKWSSRKKSSINYTIGAAMSSKKSLLVEPILGIGLSIGL